MAKNITLLGASYSDVPAVNLPQTGGGTARFTDTSPTTATDSDVASGKIYFKADGSQSTGTSSGSSKNAQAHESTSRATSSTYTSVNSLTCNKTGTYTVYWSTMRSSTGGTSGSQLYIGGSAYGTADTANWSNHVQNKVVTGVSITKNDTVAVYARSRGSNYYAYVPLITIIEE